MAELTTSRVYGELTIDKTVYAKYGGATSAGLTTTPSMILGQEGALRGTLKLITTTADRYTLLTMSATNFHMDVSVGGGMYINYYSNANIYVGSAAGNQLRPYTTNTGFVGTSTGKFLAMYATTFYGDLVGTASLTSLNIGGIGTTSNTSLTITAGDLYRAEVKLYGSAQGTGNVFVGQSSGVGGGMMYNGDVNPAFITGETADHITFYRINGATSAVVFEYGVNDSQVDFKGAVTVAGVLSVAGAIADDATYDGVLTRDTNDQVKYRTAANLAADLDSLIDHDNLAGVDTNRHRQIHVQTTTPTGVTGDIWIDTN